MRREIRKRSIFNNIRVLFSMDQFSSDLDLKHGRNQKEKL